MDEASKKRARGVFLLPNLLTTGALFSGFYSIVSGINGHYMAAAVAVVVAGLLDGLDGRVARMTNTQSDFGVQYDSLSDLVSFGLAPALLSFNWSLRSLGEVAPLAGKLGWLAAFLYVACAALRLARFNTQAGIEDKTHFQGLASPAAAGTLVTTIWFFVDQGVSGEAVRWLILLETVALGILMFSRVRYFSFKRWPKGDRVPITWIFLAVVLFIFLAVDPPAMMMLTGLFYVISGLIMTLIAKRNWKLRRASRLAARRRRARAREQSGEDRTE